VRRGFIAERYAELIEALYSGVTSLTIDARVRFEDGRVGQIRANVPIREAAISPEGASSPSPAGVDSRARGDA